MSLGDIITAIVAVIGIGFGAFAGNIWGRMRGESTGRSEAMKEVERQRGREYRETRERIDAAPKHTDSDSAAEFLRNRKSRPK